VQVAGRGAAGRERHVEPLAREARLALAGAQGVAAFGHRALHGLLGAVHGLAAGGALLGRELAQAAQLGRDLAALAEPAGADLVQGVVVGGLRDLAERLLDALVQAHL